MAKREIFTRYGKRPVDKGVGNFGKSIAVQSEKENCDINRIMAKYLKTGTLPANVATARYGDFSEAGDYQAAQDILLVAREQFAALPSKVRDRFRNDPRLFLEFVHNKDNFDEALSLGLLSAEAVAKKAKNDAAAAAPAANAAATK